MIEEAARITVDRVQPVRRSDQHVTARLSLERHKDGRCEALATKEHVGPPKRAVSVPRIRHRGVRTVRRSTVAWSRSPTHPGDVDHPAHTWSDLADRRRAENRACCLGRPPGKRGAVARPQGDHLIGARGERLIEERGPDHDGELTLEGPNGGTGPDGLLFAVAPHRNKRAVMVAIVADPTPDATVEGRGVRAEEDVFLVLSWHAIKGRRGPDRVRVVEGKARHERA